MKLPARLVVNLVTVLLLGVVSVGWVVASLVGEGIGGGPFIVTVDLASSGGVFTNQEVTYRGVLVGRVGDLELNDTGVDLELLIDRGWLGEIPADVIATVRSKSAVGEQYVNLTPQSTTDEMLTDGDEIARANTDLPVEFQDLLRGLDRVLAEVPPDTTRRLIGDLSGGIAGRSNEIGTILRSLGTLAEGFASVAPQQKRLLDNAPRAGAEFLRTKDQFAAALAATDEALDPLADEAALRELFTANDRFARAGIALLARHGDDLASGIGGLADLMTFQVENKQGILGSLEHLPGFLHAVEDASIPWESPDGRRYYRIRTGLIFDNVKASWPCGYRFDENYARQPHIRTQKRVLKQVRCRPSTSDDAEAKAVAAAIASALRTLADAHSERVSRVVAPTLWDRPSFGFLKLRR
jgi:phospholipid/cholesterol/gamma-HCH transport system substrate-binding protein